MPTFILNFYNFKKSDARIPFKPKHATNMRYFQPKLNSFFLCQELAAHELFIKRLKYSKGHD